MGRASVIQLRKPLLFFLYRYRPQEKLAQNTSKCQSDWWGRGRGRRRNWEKSLFRGMKERERERERERENEIDI